MKDIQKSINYFCSLIDLQGIIQFTTGRDKALEYGYAIEDQARGLLVALQTHNQPVVEHLLSQIMACQIDGGGVKMLWNKNGRFLEKKDNFGEASAEVLWALATYQKIQPDSNIQKFINYLIGGLSKSVEPRVIGYSLLGLYELGDKDTTIILANRLVKLFEKYSSKNWLWFETEMTYINALMPWGLLKAYQLTGKKEYLEIGLKSLNFLLENLQRDGIPVVVGNIGWWKKGREMALFDQQPIDVSYLVLACLDFYKKTNDNVYLEKAKFYFSWFSGNNLKKANMIHPDGGCSDGLSEFDPNLNAGAESTICYLLASLALQNF